MHVYRITNCIYSRDLSGKGASLYGGRWNNKNTYIVYTAESRSLALLEIIAHMGKIPLKGFCLVTIDIPDDCIQIFPVENLPDDCFANPAPDYIKVIGDNFIKVNKYLALKLPSSLMREENNYLLNPRHSGFNKIRVVNERTIDIDSRLFH